MRLKDKVAIITGAGQGIGKAYAKRFLEEGAKVAVAEINPDRGKPAAEELAKVGDCVFVQVDVSDQSSAEQMASAVADRWGTIDILINNAAIYYDMDQSDHSFEYQQKVMSVNMFGAWIASNAVVPHMLKQGSGSIINQASGAAYIYLNPLPEKASRLPTFHYSWAKWGVVGLTRFMAGTLGVRGIRVNCISPGVTMTEATKKTVDPNMISMITLMTAMRQTLEPEDLCGAAVFFASDDSSKVTGQTLSVDAGFYMG